MQSTVLRLYGISVAVALLPRRGTVVAGATLSVEWNYARCSPFGKLLAVLRFGLLKGFLELLSLPLLLVARLRGSLALVADSAGSSFGFFGFTR